MEATELIVHADEVPVEGTTAGDIDLQHFSSFFERQYGESLDQALEKARIPLAQLLNNLTVENIRNGLSNIRNPRLASFATKELPYRGIGTGIRRALAVVPDLELESDHERNLFTASIPRRA